MTQLLGHNKTIGQLGKLVGEKRFPNASLFYGLSGIGKRKAAMEIAALLLCEEPRGEACGQCSSCTLIKAGNHPDLFIVEATPPKSAKSKKNVDVTDDGDSENEDEDITPKKNKTSKNLTVKIEDIRVMKSKLGLWPMMGKAHVGIIDDAHLMSSETANSLLKLLEEPKSHQYFIMVTGQFYRILPTLRSRSSKFYFSPLADQDLLTIVQKKGHADISADEISFFSRSFQGSAGYVLSALASGWNPSLYEMLIRSRKTFQGLNQAVRDVCDQDGDLRLLLHVLRVRHLDRALKGETENLDFFNSISQAEIQLARNLPKEFLLENLFL